MRKAILSLVLAVGICMPVFAFDTYKAAYDSGLAKYRQKEYDEAIKDFQAAVELGKTPAEKSNAISFIGLSYRLQSKWAESREAYEKLAALEGATVTTVSSALNSIADTYRREKEPEKARETYNKALALEGNTPVMKALAHAGLAQLHIDAKEYDEALTQYRAALALAEENNLDARYIYSPLHGIGVTSIIQKKYPEARQAYEKVLTLDKLTAPMRLEALVRLGDIAAAEQQYGKAHEYYAQALQVEGITDSYIIRTIYNDAQVYVTEGNLEKAKEQLTKITANETYTDAQKRSAVRLLQQVEQRMAK